MRSKGEPGGWSCAAQQETFNSVTPGLNYHAETIVSGKIKERSPPGGGRRTAVSSSSSSSFSSQSFFREEQTEMERCTVYTARVEKGTTIKSLFRLQAPVVALGLTRLRLRKKHR